MSLEVSSIHFIIITQTLAPLQEQSEIAIDEDVSPHPDGELGLVFN
jgi:hypothetical protein